MSKKLLYDYGLTVDSILPWKQVQAIHRGQYMSELLNLVEGIKRTGFMTVPNLGKFKGELKNSANEEVEQFSHDHNCLDRVRNILLEVTKERLLPGVNTEGMDWGESLTAADEQRLYDYKVKGSNENISGFKNVGELSRDADWAGIENEITVRRTTEQVGEALSFFLSTASKLYIVDPYLLKSIIENGTNSRFLTSLKEIDRRIYENRAEPLHSLEIHSYRKTKCDGWSYTQESDFNIEYVDKKFKRPEQANAIELIRKYMPNCADKLDSKKMQLHLWRCNPEAEGACVHMHDRYILSGYRGIELPHGIDFAMPEEKSKKEANLILRAREWSRQRVAQLNPNKNYWTHLNEWNLAKRDVLSSMTTRPVRRR